jgi:hypothetical protein
VARQVWTEASNWSSLPSFHPASWGTDKAMLEWFGKLCGTTRHTSALAKGARSLAIYPCVLDYLEGKKRQGV